MIAKTSFRITPWVLLIMFAVISCDQEPQKGSVRFGLEMDDHASLKSATDPVPLSAALVTIRYAGGNLLYEKEHLPLYSFGESYTTQSLDLPSGNFRLEEFMLIDSEGVVRWATPREGSDLARLVRQPLPVSFGVSPGETTNLDIQVIRTGDHPPAGFGYVNFDIGFVETFCLKVFFDSGSMEDGGGGNDSVPAPGQSDFPIYRPMLKIRSGNRVVMNEPLQEGIHQYRIPISRNPYELIASDWRGQVVYREVFSLEELMEHRCSDTFEPLVITSSPGPGIVITPEGLDKPSIGQGIFGQVTTGLDSFMLDSTVYPPVVRDICLYPYSVWETMWDSIRTFAPINCYLPEEFLPAAPLAIVRSNSAGYFQLGLRPGEYLYLVREGDRFYIPAYLSSQMPGFVRVTEGQVTFLPIHIIDCSMWM